MGMTAIYSSSDLAIGLLLIILLFTILGIKLGYGIYEHVRKKKDYLDKLNDKEFRLVKNYEHYKFWGK